MTEGGADGRNIICCWCMWFDLWKVIALFLTAW